MTNKSYILRYILYKIAVGEYALYASIPSEHSLAQYLSSSRITIHNALETLKSNCLLKSVKGSGYYVDMSIDAYLNYPLANLYARTTDIQVENLEIATFDFNGQKFNFCYQMTFLHKQKVLCTHYVFSRQKIHWKLKVYDWNLARSYILSGIDDFFSVKTLILPHVADIKSLPTYAFLHSFIIDDLVKSAIAINEYENLEEEIQILTVTKFPPKNFLLRDKKKIS
ncbi:GntR family transcriptional regulator [Ureaplasma miroungigenitalium]|uniref:GntR family transcriptional regulator n=1 Tax=Ureaplasma miroungigenitalium TaxID=1042321 RepID=A0ABT3BML5_9BACT|nr:GntR family transcriptional regulator [Ureaplasma miroungigenitalium]MCV3728471.1 GntR family transcriptional regulator [Ureaplasma miroungigenitalium]MCV3734258.1 GntR family transcriptional regulator [Ureaplasma miroungigenitalium]